jgi:endonuclease/exonuclease/phosphatase family metal-dependent hydrolase
MSLKILTYNVSWEGLLQTKTNTTDGTVCNVNGTNKCLENIVSLLTASHADIICLQEASISIRYLLTELRKSGIPYEGIYHMSGKESMLTIYNPGKTGILQSSIPGEFEPGRPYLIAVFEGIVVVNVHGQPNVDFTKKLTEDFDKYRKVVTNRAVIVAGDFNMATGEYLPVFGRYFDTGLRLQTANTCCSSSFGTRGKEYNYAFDHIAIDERLQFDSIILPLKAENNVLFSDHLPVMASVSLSQTPIIDPKTNIVIQIQKKHSLLYRGVSQQCPIIREGVRSTRSEWLAQDPQTARIYTKLGNSKEGCLLIFKAIRDLKFIDVWRPETLKVIIAMASVPGNITPIERDAFIVFSGYGVDKSLTPFQPLAIANRYGWAAQPATDPKIVSIHGEELPAIKLSSSGTAQYVGLEWGRGTNNFDRTSTFEGDMIVMKMLQRFFPSLDGVYARAVPSTFHGGVFAEEFILFPNAADKVKEVHRNVGGSYRRRRSKRRRTYRKRKY